MGTHASNSPSQDVVLADDPKMAYTEKVLEEKEQMLRKYIQDNYSKIQNVERELAGLAMEVKLTAGPKKAALEHLRKLIEVSTEKIKSARVKEEQARKVWEAAQKIVEAEELHKQKICEDLKCLVEQSAEAQYTRLQELTSRLEALNPGLQGGPTQVLAGGIHSSSSDGFTPQQQVSQPDDIDAGSNAAVDGNNVPTVAAIVASINSASPGPPTSPESQGHTAGFEKAQNGVHSTRPVVRGQHVPVPRGRGRGATRTKGPMQLGRSKSETDEGGWTGAGFDVEDTSS